MGTSVATLTHLGFLTEATTLFLKRLFSSLVVKGAWAISVSGLGARPGETTRALHWACWGLEQVDSVGGMVLCETWGEID